MTDRPEANRVLVVEDDVTQRLKLAGILEQAGYVVDVACNGEEGLVSARANPPHLVISDIEMPLMDGYELCSRIRADQHFRGTSVVLLTSYADVADVLKGLARGADNYIAKPYDITALLDVVRTTLEGGEDHAGGESARIVPVHLGKETLEVSCTRQQVLNFFLSMYRDAVTRHDELTRAHEKLRSFSANLSGLVEEKTAALRGEVLQRRKAEEESQHRAELLDKAHEAIILTDVNGCVQFWNMGAERLYGWPAKDATGLTLGDMLHDKNHPAPSNALRSTIEKGEWEGELVQLTGGGKERTVQSSWTLVRDDSGAPNGILTINLDVSERKKLEADFLRTQRLESIGMLAGGIAHDLNNLVGPIPMAVQILKGKINDPKVERTLSLIESGARRALDVVQQVLAFSRGTAGTKVAVQTKHLLREMYLMAKESFPPSIDFRLECPTNLATVHGDATQLHQIIMNLCVNARDAMPEGGSILLQAVEVDIDGAYAAMNADARPGRYVRLSVKDTGTGIPKSIRDEIFLPFFTTKGPGSGTGLGLSTVLSIVRAHGGFLRLESEPGSGTEFQVFIPVAEGIGESSAAGEKEPAAGGNGETVLFVDDEPFLREIIATTLDAAGYQVLTANDGIDALALFARRGGDIRAVVVDLLMPNLDGPATIKALRKMDPSVCLIAISGNDEAAQLAASWLPPSIPLLRKPFTSGDLLSALRSVIRRQGDAPAGSPGDAPVPPGAAVPRAA